MLLTVPPERRPFERGAKLVLAFVQLAVLAAFLAPAAKAQSGCTAAERDAQLVSAQQQILQMLRPAPGVDLTTLRNEADLSALAALGYNVYAHQQVSFEGMGWGVLDGLAPQDPELARPLPGRPTELVYAPAVPPPPGTVTEPRDGFDFPYVLAGWIYIVRPYDFGQHPLNPLGRPEDAPFWGCIDRGEWFVHERGVHPFESGGMVPIPPEEEEHGTAPGQDLPFEALGPGDLPHERVWDLHVWCRPAAGDQCSGDQVATVSMLNPGEPIPGIDPHAGQSPPAGWPDTATDELPWFYHPQRAADLSVAVVGSADSVKVGKPITYTIIVRNQGPDRATEVTLTASVPRHADSVAITGSPGSCSETKTVVTCDVGALDAGAFTRVTIELRPSRRGTVTNTASVKGNEVELKEKADSTLGWTKAGAMDDNLSTVTTTVLP